jgi:copper resistance protein C
MTSRPTRRACRLTVASALLLLPVVAAGLADAHAKLARSDPPAATTLRGTPPEIRLWFTENLEPTFSTARLLDGDRRAVDGAAGRVDAVNAALLRMSLPPLASGHYTVVYRVVSVDSHVTTGELTFRVAR